MDYAQQQRDPAKHLVGLSIVALLHVLIIYALVTGLARKAIDVIKKPIETKIVEEAKPPPPPEQPPPPPPKMATPPPPFIPPPEVQIAVAPAPTAITAVTKEAPPPVAKIEPTPPPVQHVPVRVGPVIRKEDCREPEYPPASRRADETGTVTLRFYVDEEGHATRAEVIRSSGHKRLDEAARAALSLCKFKPGTLDGKAMPMTGDLQYVWKLE